MPRQNPARRRRRRRPKQPAKEFSEEAKQANQQAPRFAISAKEAAARIKADVAAHVAALGDDPDGILRGGF